MKRREKSNHLHYQPRLSDVALIFLLLLISFTGNKPRKPCPFTVPSPASIDRLLAPSFARRPQLSFPLPGGCKWENWLEWTHQDGGYPPPPPLPNPWFLPR